MGYGVSITGGARDWQIFQRGADGCTAINLTGRWRRARISPDVPVIFTDVREGAVTVKARVALESSGESVIDWRVCELTAENGWRVTFDSVPSGGLYRLETYMEYEGWDGLSVTRGDVVRHVGVGDVFLIAGQSNAAGRAKTPFEDGPELGVHMFRASGHWDLASHPLNETTDAVFTGHFENHNPGHSPWLVFGKIIRREANCPVGLINAAYGGSPLSWWNPAQNGALWKNAFDMLKAADIHSPPKAALWYQGEAEAYTNEAGDYSERFAAFVKTVRADLNAPVPFITVQLNRDMEPPNEALDRQWGIVREAQRRSADEIDGVYVVPSGDLPLYDAIHNSPEANAVLGERCARAALCELYGRGINYKGCAVKRAIKESGDTVRLEFDNISSWLNPLDPPPELLPFEAEDGGGFVAPIAYTTGRDSLVITFARELEEGAALHGAWRARGAVCLPRDCLRMPMLSFYGLKIE